MIYPFNIYTDVGDYQLWASNKDLALSTLKNDYGIKPNRYWIFHRDDFPDWCGFEEIDRMISRFENVEKARRVIWLIDELMV